MDTIAGITSLPRRSDVVKGGGGGGLEGTHHSPVLFQEVELSRRQNQTPRKAVKKQGSIKESVEGLHGAIATNGELSNVIFQDATRVMRLVCTSTVVLVYSSTRYGGSKKKEKSRSLLVQRPCWNCEHEYLRPRSSYLVQ